MGDTQKKQTYDLLNRTLKLVAAPIPMTGSEWADTYRMLSPEASNEPGPWRTSRSPYQREPLNAITDSQYETIVMMWSAQLGKTELQNNAVGYFTHWEPSPIIFIQPNLVQAKEYSKDRLAPMYRDTPVLRERVRKKTLESSNTVLYKSFPGGRINIAGANSPESLASKPIRVVLCDEIDRYPVSSGREGDPVDLVTARQKTFPNRKRVLVSTPTIKGASRIETLYEDSTMEEWCLPCPGCGEHQPLKWHKIKFKYDEEEKKCTEAKMECEFCGFKYDEQEWKKNHDVTGKWIARKKHPKVRGFHLNELASTFRNWFAIVEDFKKANREGRESLKTFFNTSMAESWEEKPEVLDAEVLLNRREIYHADVPEGVKILTAAVDTQDNRFEVEVQGWGAGHENWRIEYTVIPGDLTQPTIWNDLDQYLMKKFTDQHGRPFEIAVTFMDSGGHFTNEVYKFTKPRAGRRIFAIKGISTGDGTYKPLLSGMSTNNIYKATMYLLGVHEGKTKVMHSVMQNPVDENGFPAQGRVHFPMTTDDRNRGYNKDYFEGLTAEVLRTDFRHGVAYQTWVKVKKRNEPLDLAVYNRAAIELLRVDLDAPLPPYDPLTASTTVGAPAPAKRRRGTKGVSIY